MNIREDEGSRERVLITTVLAKDSLVFGMLYLPPGVVVVLSDLGQAEVLITPPQEDGEDLEEKENATEGEEGCGREDMK